jgi:myo-inositol-1(or 4)-monophosphatase
LPDARDRDDLQLISEAARIALGIAAAHFGKSPETWSKDGGSPVSVADIEVDQFLRKMLLAARPDYGWVSEETADDPIRMTRRRIFVVDPIDGTRAFIAGDRNWCVSIAIVENGLPTAGVLAGPSADGFYAAHRGGGATLEGKPMRLSQSQDRAQLLIAGPKKGFPLTYPANSVVVPRIPSLALRIARVASGEVDLACAGANSHEWDIAAADLILSEAGGRLTDVEGNGVRYNREALSQRALIAAKRELHSGLLTEMQAMAVA